MQSETVGALAAALAKAQGQIRPAAMDRDNPFFKSRYATLTSLWESARAALAANGLAVTQATDLDNAGNIVLITTLMHASGEWVGSVYPVRAKDNAPQTIGSAITYARRYAFGALVGLSADDDDDGNAASTPNGNHTPAKQQEVKPANKPAAVAASDGSHTSSNGGAAGGAVDKRTLNKLHAVGSDLYGDEWNTKRHVLAKSISKGRTESSKELTQAEAERMISGMEDRLHEKLAAEVPHIADAEPIPA